MKKQDYNKSIEIIENIGTAKLVNAVPVLIKYLEETDDSRVRNAIALALSDIGCPHAIEPLISLITNPKTSKSRGTLLYALEAFDYRNYSDIIVNQLFEENFEASRQAFTLLELIIDEIPWEKRQKYIERIKEIIKTSNENLLFYYEAIDLFKFN